MAILPGSYDHLNVKESHASAGNAMLAEKTAKANGEFTVQDVEVIRQTVRRLKENGVSAALAPLAHEILELCHFGILKS